MPPFVILPAAALRLKSHGGVQSFGLDLQCHLRVAEPFSAQ